MDYKSVFFTYFFFMFDYKLEILEKKLKCKTEIWVYTNLEMPGKIINTTKKVTEYLNFLCTIKLICPFKTVPMLFNHA